MFWTFLGHDIKTYIMSTNMFWTFLTRIIFLSDILSEDLKQVRQLAF